MEIVPQQIPDNIAKREKLISTTYIILGVVVFVLLITMFIWALIWLANNHADTIEALRDIFIIGLAMASCAFSIVTIILTIMIVRLINMLEFEIKPVLEKTNETVSMVRGTTSFVSENVVRPVTTASGYIAGVKRGLQVLLGDPRKNLK